MNIDWELILALGRICIFSASLAPVQEWARLCLQPHPGHLDPGDPDSGLGHVGYPGIVPDYVQQHRVASLHKAGRALVPLTSEILTDGVSGSSFASDNIYTL